MAQLQAQGGIVACVVVLLGMLGIWNVSAQPVDPCTVTGAQLNTEQLGPLLSPAEVALFKKYVGQARYYFETGSGGSTFIASGMPNLKRIEVVESDVTWLNKLRKYKPVHDAMCVHKKLRMHHVDVGAKPNAIGVPHDSSMKSMWTLYGGAIALYAGSPWEAKPDLVFVDGRFRVAAVMHAYKVIDEGALIMMHDYDRKQYHVVETVVRKVEQVERLAVFKVTNRTATTMALAEQLLHRYGHVYL